MKNVYQKIMIWIFVGIISLIFVFTLAFNYNDIIDNLYENKEKIFDFSLTEEYFKGVVNTIEGSYDGSIFLRDKYIDLYGGLQRLMGKKVIWDANPNKTIVVGDDGKLYPAGNIAANFTEYENDTERLFGYAQNLSLFGEHVKQNGGNLIFMQAPSRFDSEKVKTPIQLKDTGKRNVDALYEFVKDDANLSVINLQTLYREQGKDFSELFFKTDHHWTVKTAFWAYEELCKELNSMGLGIDNKYFDLANYKVETIKNRFLGSIGARVGNYFIGTDDFDYIYPEFQTNYKKKYSRNYNQSIDRGGAVSSEGDFRESVLNNYKLTVEGKNNVTLGTYVNGDVAETIITNSLPATDKKVLFIKDSFALPVAAFTSNCFKETRLLDLRYFTEKTASEYVEGYKPDIVVVLYNPSSYSERVFKFTK